MSTHNMFLWRTDESYLWIIIKYPSYLLHCPQFTCTAAASSAAKPIVCGASWVTINLPVLITDWNKDTKPKFILVASKFKNLKIKVNWKQFAQVHDLLEIQTEPSSAIDEVETSLLDRKLVVVICFNVDFNNFSIISRRCLVATGSSMLTFIVLPH